MVGTHQRQGIERFWSVSREILNDAPMSVACVPASSTGEPVSECIPTFQRVLVSTDFSTLGNRAIPFAYATLYQGGVMCLFHALKPAGAGPKAREATHKLKRAEEQLRELIPSEAAARWIVTKVEVVESDRPSTAICQAAERFGADLICIGSHGRSGLSKAILGSVAQDVMARCHLPVMVVQPPVP